MQNNLSKILDISSPIIQAPMYGVTTPEMVAAANRAGCLGTAALGDLDFNSSVEIIRSCKKITGKGFAANIFVNNIPAITDELKLKYNRTKEFLYELAAQLNFKVTLPDIEEIKPSGYKEQVEAILEEQIRILSFTFGNLDESTIKELKNNSVILIGTCTNENEAQMLASSGIDVICVQGIEAGGHRGSFAEKNIPGIGGIALLQNVREIIKNPVIYAGGIGSRKTIESLLALGADGFQIGTMLLCSEESALTSVEKERLNTVSDNEIILTKSFSGRYARGLHNKFIELFEHSDYVLPYPYQNKLTGPFRKAARNAQQTEWLHLWIGQAYKNLSYESTEKILASLILA